jgi:RNA polymerase sigma factor (TIGR02999 family)
VDITGLLQQAHNGDRSGLDAAMPLIYRELKKLAASHLSREGSRQSPMAATTLVHEAYLRLVHANHPAYQNRAHFYSIASRVMRQILVDAARSRMSSKRGGAPPLQLNDLAEFGTEPDRVVLAVDEALDRLSRISEIKAILIEMHYFGGMTADECAEARSMSVHMVRKELRLAQAWLRAELACGTP